MNASKLNELDYARKQALQLADQALLRWKMNGRVIGEYAGVLEAKRKAEAAEAAYMQRLEEVRTFARRTKNRRGSNAEQLHRSAVADARRKLWTASKPVVEPKNVKPYDPYPGWTVSRTPDKASFGKLGRA